MAKIAPFQAYRYTEKAGSPEALLTQPYDKITPQMRADYLGHSPYNLVRIILGEPLETDSATENVYTRAAAHLKDWTENSILARDPEPSIYPYFQEFQIPGTTQRVTRKGFIGLGPVAEYSEGIVHRHEQTLSGPKKDRLELLRAARAHFGQLFMLYPDPACAVDSLLDEAATDEPLLTVTDEYGTIHRMWRRSDPEWLGALTMLMEDKKLLIADGHHRYETALAFRRENPDFEPAQRVMMTFVNMHSSGLKVLATHRLVNGVRDLNAVELAQKVQTSCRVEPVGSLEDYQKRMAEPSPEHIRIGVAIAGTEGLYLLEADRDPGQLDVDYLHGVILEGVLGIDSEAVREQKNLTYVRGAAAAVDAVRRGEAQVAFLLEAPDVEQVAAVSFSGGVMPQKSTDFYPKLLSGLTVYKLDG